MSKTSSSLETDTSLSPIDGLTVKEVAYKLRVDPKTVYGWCSNGKIEFFRIGGESGSIRIKKDQLGKLIHTNLSMIDYS